MIRHCKALLQKPLSSGARAGLGIFILGMGIADWVVRWRNGYYLLPLQLCDVTLILAAVVWLFPKKRRVGELVVLWTLSGSVQAVLTPDLSEGFPSPTWFFFFGTHVCVIWSSLYFLCVEDVELSWASVRRASVWTVLYAAGIMLINGYFRLNYGYFTAKPDHPSLLDYFGPWPYYVVVEGVLAVVFFSAILAFGKAIQKKDLPQRC